MADGFDYSGLQYSGYTPPDYSFPDVGGFATAMPDFSMAPSPTFNMPDFGNGGLAGFNPQLDFSGIGAPVMPEAAPQAGGGGGFLQGLFGHQPSGMEIGLLGAGLLPLLMGTFGAFGNQRPREQQATSGAQTTAQVAPPAGPAENTALLNALLGTFSPILNPSLVEQAFQPQLGSLTQQAIEQAQRAGFHTSPLESPVAERIMGQGLSDLQGQIAAAKLGQQQFASNLGANLLGTLQAGRLGQRTTTQTGQSTGITSQLGGPSPLFGSAQQLSQMLGGFGGLLGGLAAYSKPQTQNTLSGA